MFITNSKIKALSNKLIILDIDGTIAYDNQHDIDTAVIDIIKILKRKNDIYLCSNSRNTQRNAIISDATHIPLIISPYRKPSKKIIRYIKKSTHTDIVVIGDKFLTDGIFSIRIKGDFIKVRRLRSGEERPSTKLFNLLDDIAYFIWKKMGKIS
ncbi:MAG: hypothetical protein PHT88_01415 [Candidatus Moranbacteria bacterium]|nr:hypothetical protein [Candidatus Moranbacteria bacterium]